TVTASTASGAAMPLHRSPVRPTGVTATSAYPPPRAAPAIAASEPPTEMMDASDVEATSAFGAGCPGCTVLPRTDAASAYRPVRTTTRSVGAVTDPRSAARRLTAASS